MGNPWKVEIELSYRRRRDRNEDRGRGKKKMKEKGLHADTERDDARVGGEEVRKNERPAREGGKMGENKIYPGHWRDFVSYILFEPIGFIYAGGPGGWGRARGCTRRNNARLVKEFPSFPTSPSHPHHALSLSGTPHFIVYLIPRCLSPSRSRISCRFKQIFQRQKAVVKAKEAMEKRAKKRENERE